MTDTERVEMLRLTLARLHSQALIECAAGGNGFDEMVRDVTADALEATK